MFELLVILFLVGVGIAALVVTFPWGLAAFLVFLIWKYGFENTVDDVRALLVFLFKVLGYLLVAFLGIVFLIGIFGK